jgi:hypothetical protein
MKKRDEEKGIWRDFTQDEIHEWRCKNAFYLAHSIAWECCMHREDESSFKEWHSMMREAGEIEEDFFDYRKGEHYRALAGFIHAESTAEANKVKKLIIDERDHIDQDCLGMAMESIGKTLDARMKLAEEAGAIIRNIIGGEYR